LTARSSPSAARTACLGIYYAGGGAGYLLASSQGSRTFVIDQRQSPNAYVMTVNVGAANGIAAVTGTDGIDVTNVNLGAHRARRGETC
jgi:3-phytase